MSAEKATYSHGHHASVVQSHARRTVENSAEFLLPHIKPTDRILDIGCGPGSITIGLAQRAHKGQVIGIDAVPAVLEQANALATEHNITNVTFEAMDANRLPFQDASFDVVFCHQVLQHVADPVNILTEMRRVTKNGGFVAAREADYASFAWYPESEGLSRWARLYDRNVKANGAEPNAGRYLPQWARDAGFPSTAVTFNWNCWNYQENDAKVFGAAWVGRVLLSGFASTAKKHSFASDAELQEISNAWKEWSDQPHCFIIIPNGEVLCRVEDS